MNYMNYMYNINYTVLMVVKAFFIVTVVFI